MRRVVSGLGDRDSVEGGVELPVAGAREAVALGASRAGFEWRDAGVAGELGVALEAIDRSDLGEQFRGGDGRARGRESDALNVKPSRAGVARWLPEVSRWSDDSTAVAPTDDTFEVLVESVGALFQTRPV